VSKGVLREVDEEMERAAEMKGAAARSPREEACRGSFNGLTGVGGTVSTAPKCADEADADDVEKKSPHMRESVRCPTRRRSCGC